MLIGNTMPECSDWRRPYIAGLVDNRAAVAVTIAKRSEIKIGFGVRLKCRIKLPAAESLEILTTFADEHDIVYRVDTDRDTTYDSYQFVISRRQSMQTFLRLLQPYLVVRDEAAELLCETIIPRLEAGDHQSKASFLSLMQDIETFRELVGRANRAKYDLEFFQDEWKMEAPS
jgi:hypothetical protein